LKTCECGGDYLRHGLSYYKSDPNLIGIRYKCRDCKKTHTERFEEDTINGVFFNYIGRPTLKDSRYDTDK
jgi:hypothetical protein